MKQALVFLALFIAAAGCGPSGGSTRHLSVVSRYPYPVRFRMIDPPLNPRVIRPSESVDLGKITVGGEAHFTVSDLNGRQLSDQTLTGGDLDRDYIGSGWRVEVGP